MVNVCRRVTEIDDTASVLWLGYRQHRLEDLRVAFQLAAMDLKSKGPGSKDDISVGEPEILAHAEWEIKSGVTLLLESVNLENRSRQRQLLDHSLINV
jgi:hypothetical protein